MRLLGHEISTIYYHFWVGNHSLNYSISIREIIYKTFRPLPHLYADLEELCY